MHHTKEQDVEKGREKTGIPGGAKEHDHAQHGGRDDDPCRCKQVSVMTPRQLLGTMLKDLAFWKKEKK